MLRRPNRLFFYVSLHLFLSPPPVSTPENADSHVGQDAIHFCRKEYNTNMGAYNARNWDSCNFDIMLKPCHVYSHVIREQFTSNLYFMLPRTSKLLGLPLNIIFKQMDITMSVPSDVVAALVCPDL